MKKGIFKTKKIIKQLDENVNPSKYIEEAIGYFFLQHTYSVQSIKIS